MATNTWKTSWTTWACQLTRRSASVDSLPLLYSPECVKGGFCELRGLRVLRTSRRRGSPKFVRIVPVLFVNNMPFGGVFPSHRDLPSTHTDADRRGSILLPPPRCREGGRDEEDRVAVGLRGPGTAAGARCGAS